VSLNNPDQSNSEYTDHRIFKERERTNLFKKPEQVALTFLCHNMPNWVTPNMLTVIGFIGSLVTSLGLILAADNRYYFLLSIFGLAVQWFGDSLDGRIAYYRNTPRKWFGFSLDMIMDWISTIIIGIGFHTYLPEGHKLLAFVFITSYGWTMIIALLKYKITDQYAIDSGLLGPTEFRLAIGTAFLVAVFVPGTIQVFAIVVNIVVVTVCMIDFYKVVNLGDKRDKEERANKLSNS
jgi:phosphatidylglycerophosphate synthase